MYRPDETMITNETDSSEKYISKFMNDSNFESLNYLKNSRKNSGLSANNLCFSKNIEFISVNKDINSVYYNLMSEKEFFKVVEYNNNRHSSKNGKYQKSLYEHYLQAKAEHDSGYINDVLKKAIVLRKNINYVKKLMKNKCFMKKWHKNYGRKSPLSVLKYSGDMTLINIINVINEQ